MPQFWWRAHGISTVPACYPVGSGVLRDRKTIFIIINFIIIVKVFLRKNQKNEKNNFFNLTAHRKFYRSTVYRICNLHGGEIICLLTSIKKCMKASAAFEI